MGSISSQLNNSRVPIALRKPAMNADADANEFFFVDTMMRRVSAKTTSAPNRLSSDMSSVKTFLEHNSTKCCIPGSRILELDENIQRRSCAKVASAISLPRSDASRSISATIFLNVRKAFEASCPPRSATVALPPSNPNNAPCSRSFRICEFTMAHTTK